MSESKGNIHYVAKGDPKYMFHVGEGFTREHLPVGTRVIYPNKPLPGIPDVKKAVQDALKNPEGTDPLESKLKPGMKVTIAFDDISLPLPPMKTPDIRQTIMEEVVAMLDKNGIDDIHFICAICLHRRMTPAELRRAVGPNIFNRFHPDRLYNHDAEDPDGNVLLGQTEHKEDVEINKRAAESDLLIYVNINLVTMDGGHKSVPVGLGTYKTVKHHHNVHTMQHESSYMDVPRSTFHRSCERQGAVVDKHVEVFTIETTLNSDTFPSMLGFLQKREHDWNWFDKLNYTANATSLNMLPYGIRRKIFHSMPAPYGVTGVVAGKTDPVHDKTLDAVLKQQRVVVEGQADVVIYGMPYVGPYNVNSIMNPILVNVLSAGYFFNFFMNKPLVRKGGVMILLHPFENKFHPIHHPSYIDFFNDILSETKDPAEIEKKYEKQYAENEEYIDKYRNSYAYHGVHPFYMWYWACQGMAHLEKIIAVAPKSPMAAERVGHAVAPTLDSAIGMAKDLVGQDASITYYHNPPIFMCDVV